MKHLLLILLLLPLVACQRVPESLRNEVDRCNERSYHDRYIDIDSALWYAKRAEQLSENYTDGRTEAKINQAFVLYQQMKFDDALDLLSVIEKTSRNQFLLLATHILQMKVAQRVGDGESFFAYRSRSRQILDRIEEGFEPVSPHYAAMVNHAFSELHIVSSTYYYYLGLDSAAQAEIQQAYDYVKDSRDTAQWLNYNYMLGSGGLIVGEKDEVVLREFEHLFLTYTLAKARNYTYFEANALQSLASMMADTCAANLIRQEQTGSFNYLSTEYPTDDASEDLSFAMARRTIYLFEKNKDLYQTACAYRTLGELYFANEDYELALDIFKLALKMVEDQQETNPSTVNPWIANIREKLSLAYSALGDKYYSDVNRNIYLDLLDEYRQNYESETRLAELEHEVTSLRIRIYILLLLIVVTALLAWLFVKRMKRSTRRKLAHLDRFEESEDFKKFSEHVSEVCAGLSDEAELLQDELNVSRLHIQKYKEENVERRAKVAMVYSIIPYLDRMQAEVKKIKPDTADNSDRLEYIGELADEIMHINETLTDWIKMSQGSLALHISTFPLKEVLDVVSLSRNSFEERGIALHIAESDIQVKADKALTLFMVNTLLDNARKFTPDGGEVGVSVEGADDYVEISVSDTGVGLSEEDCGKLNDNKVYDASEIGNDDGRKGFGFGIMNCKGIINKYRKTSRLFGVCQFGVNSQLGAGSRFWFRLPRVLASLLIFFTLQPVHSEDLTSDFESIYDSLYTANIDGRYAEVVSKGEDFLNRLTPPFDTAYVVLIHNETAIAALATQQWDIYRKHNQECVRLHQLFTQDSSIPAYCEQMQHLHSNGILIYLFLILFSLTAAILFYLLYLRHGLRSRNIYDRLSEALSSLLSSADKAVSSYSDSSLAQLRVSVDADHFDAERDRIANAVKETSENDENLSNLASRGVEQIAGRYTEVRTILDNLFNLEEERRKALFEEDRIYVMNQILDNSLSTIKHETMYYPARAKQIVEQMQKDAQTESEEKKTGSYQSELSQLLRYYHDVYLILYNQAELQLEQHHFRRQDISVADILNDFSALLRAELDRRHLSLPFTSEADAPSAVTADRSLLHTLFRSLVFDRLDTVEALSLHAVSRENDTLFTLVFQGLAISKEEADSIFSPHGHSIPDLVARQIIREHDSSCGMLGLRLYAEPASDGSLAISFTLKKQTEL